MGILMRESYVNLVYLGLGHYYYYSQKLIRSSELIFWQIFFSRFKQWKAGTGLQD